MAFWFNISTGKVETDETRSRGEDVMGPYATVVVASHALETARAKTERWDVVDRAWADEDGDD